MDRRSFLAASAAVAATPLLASCVAKRDGETPPEDLVSFGSSFELGDGVGQGQTVTLRERRGPLISLKSGRLVVADPWYPDPQPAAAVELASGQHQCLLSTIRFVRDGPSVSMACAAAIGAVERVAGWRPLVREGKRLLLDSDSALGAFYDVADAAALRRLFADDRHMSGVYRSALTQQAVTMDLGGRGAAVVFLCPDGSATYPVYSGHDGNGRAVALLVDLKILNPRRPWNKLKGARKL